MLMPQIQPTLRGDCCQVRVNNLQELVYKQGQAGVTKASVCIRFNNTDKATSPVSWEEHDTISVTRQLIIGGSSKYLINGRVAQPRYGLAAFTEAVRSADQLQLSVSITCCNAAVCNGSYFDRLCRCCSRVQNLFHSVQLNVNNPHFLIMQGRITKVCTPVTLMSASLAAQTRTDDATGAQHKEIVDPCSMIAMKPQPRQV